MATQFIHTFARTAHVAGASGNLSFRADPLHSPVIALVTGNSNYTRKALLHVNWEFVCGPPGLASQNVCRPHFAGKFLQLIVCPWRNCGPGCPGGIEKQPRWRVQYHAWQRESVTATTLSDDHRLGEPTRLRLPLRCSLLFPPRFSSPRQDRDHRSKNELRGECRLFRRRFRCTSVRIGRCALASRESAQPGEHATARGRFVSAEPRLTIERPRLDEVFSSHTETVVRNHGGDCRRPRCSSYELTFNVLHARLRSFRLCLAK